MTEGEKTRLIAWSHELRAVHVRLREALHVTRTAVAAGVNAEAGAGVAAASRDLLLYCHGFCTALEGHHRAEDRELFPAIAAEYPQLRQTLRSLRQDHSMMAHLITGMLTSVRRADSPAELDRHLEGIAAIMESHFRYEERQLLSVLETLALEVPVERALGPL